MFEGITKPDVDAVGAVPNARYTTVVAAVPPTVINTLEEAIAVLVVAATELKTTF